VLSGLTEQQLDFLRGTIETDVAIAVAVLAALGVASVDEAEDTVALTALGRFAVGRSRGMPLPGEPVLQLRITLLDVADPPVWRRVGLAIKAIVARSGAAGTASRKMPATRSSPNSQASV
jgi:hypothetical protein